MDIQFAGKPVPGSPFHVKAKEGVDVSKIKCAPKNPVDEPAVNQELVYAVDARPVEAFPAHNPIKGTLEGPDGKKEPVPVKDNGDGTYDVGCVPKEPGPHKLDVKYEGQPIPGSPFKFNAIEGGPGSVKAFGKGMLIIRNHGRRSTLKSVCVWGGGGSGV